MKIIKIFLILFRLICLIVRAIFSGISRWISPPSLAALHENQPFLKGGYAPAFEELKEVPLGQLEKIPDDFPPGMFVRNGSNPRWTPPRPYHWFDGDGHLHSVHFPPPSPSNSKKSPRAALYTNAFVRTARFLDEERAAGPLYFGLADVLSAERLLAVMFDQLLQKVGLRPRLRGKSVANTNVLFHSRKLLALVEADVPYVVHAPSLETLGTEDWEGRVAVFTAHPKIDARTGEMAGIMYRFDQAPYCQYYLVSAAGELQIMHDVDLPVPVMMHDMAITASRALLLDLPINFRIQRILSGRSPLSFEPASPSRVGLLPRVPESSTTEPLWFAISPCFIFHTVNAWDVDEDTVVLVACAMASVPFHLFETDFEGLPADALLRQLMQDARPVVRRYVFHLGSGTVEEMDLDARVSEFPRVPPALLGRQTRYFYASHFDHKQPSPLFEGVYKYDLAHNTEVGYCAFPEDTFGGEVTFVPKRGGSAAASTVAEDQEDDGYLLTFVTNEKTLQSALAIIDAVSMELVAMLPTPQRVPYGFHGNWVSQEEIDSQISKNE